MDINGQVVTLQYNLQDFQMKVKDGNVFLFKKDVQTDTLPSIDPTPFPLPIENGPTDYSSYSLTSLKEIGKRMGLKRMDLYNKSNRQTLIQLIKDNT